MEIMRHESLVRWECWEENSHYFLLDMNEEKYIFGTSSKSLEATVGQELNLDGFEPLGPAKPIKSDIPLGFFSYLSNFHFANPSLGWNKQLYRVVGVRKSLS